MVKHVEGVGAKGDAEIPQLDPPNSFELPEDVDNLRIHTEWTSKVYGIICDLDMSLHFYDERVC